MAQASQRYEKKSNISTSHQSWNRERERLRRKRFEVGNQLPSFQEPRKITVERQDSLSNKIQTVLGDMGKIHNLIGKEPNVWLGTSRLPALNKNNNADAGVASRRKEGAHINPSSTIHHNQEQRSSNVNLPSRHPMASNNHSVYLSQHRSLSSHSSNFSTNANAVHIKPERTSSNFHSTSTPYLHSINSSSGLGMRSNQRTSGHRDLAMKDPSAPSSTHSQMSRGKGRLQNYDMESIFQEMRMKNEEPLSEIQTPRPCVGQEFNFSKYEHKPADNIATETYKGSNEVQDFNASDNDSSDNSDSDDDSYSSSDSDSDLHESDHESPSNDVDWSLKKFMGDYQKPADESMIGSVDNDFVDENTDALNNTTQYANNVEARTRPNEGTLHSNEQFDQREAAKPSTRISATSSSFKGSKTELDQIAEETRPRERLGSVSSVGSPLHHQIPTERQRYDQQAKTTNSRQFSVNKVQIRDSSSSSRGCNPDPSSSHSLLPRNSAQPRSNKDSRHQKYSSPQRAFKPKATVKTKEQKSCQSHHSNDTINSAMHSSNVNETSSSPTLNSHWRSHKKDLSSDSSESRFGRVMENKFKNSISSSRTPSSYSTPSSGHNKRKQVLSSSESEDDCTPVNCEGPFPNPVNSRTCDTNDRTDLNRSKHITSKPNSKRKNTDARSSSTATVPSLINHENGTYFPACKKLKKQSKSNRKDSSSRTDSLATMHKRPLKVMTETSKDKSSNLPARSAPSKSGKVRKSSQRSSISDAKKSKRFPSLWVTVQTNPVNLPTVVELCNTKAPTRHLSRCEVDGKGKKLSNNLLPSKSASKFDNVQQTIGLSASALASGQTEIPDNLIPSRRANEVQVAVAASTSEVYPSGQSPFNERKLTHPVSTPSAPFNQKFPAYPKEKRRKKKNSPPPYQDGNSIQTVIAKRSKNETQWEGRGKEQANNLSLSQQSNEGAQQDIPSNPQPSQPPDRTTSQQPTMNATERRNSQSVDVTAGPADSSWPGNETRIKTSDQYMREGKRLKHEGDAFADSKTGRTRSGESLNRALTYFQAALRFIMNGYTLEVENSNGRSDTSSHSPSKMYIQTIQLLDYIRKMRPHDRQEEAAFKRLNIACTRSQALLYYRIYYLKKDVAFKCSDAISDYIKPNKSSRTPSPWHTLVNGQNGVSPVSPAVPSPYGGNMPGPSPIAGTYSTCEQVTSSTQVGKMTSPSHQDGVLLSSKVMEMYKQFQSISLNLMQAHDKWDLTESLLSDHEDFFRHVDVLSAHELNLHSSLSDLATYNKVILRQLCGAYTSPEE